MPRMPTRSSPKKQLQAYFAATPPKARAALKRIRTAIRSVAPRAEEAFSYRIPAFRLAGRPLVWYAAFKNHCSLFPMTGAIRRALRADLKGYKTAKGTVQLPLAKPIPVTLVRKLVKARIAEIRNS